MRPRYIWKSQEKGLQNIFTIWMSLRLLLRLLLQPRLYNLLLHSQKRQTTREDNLMPPPGVLNCIRQLNETTIHLKTTLQNIFTSWVSFQLLLQPGFCNWLPRSLKRQTVCVGNLMPPLRPPLTTNRKGQQWLSDKYLTRWRCSKN